MAHAILERDVASRGLDINVTSAGILDFEGTPPADAAWITCIQHGAPVSKRSSTPISKIDWDEVDLTFAMENRHLSALREFSIEAKLLGQYHTCDGEHEIPDPIGKSIVDFEKCFQRIERCITGLLDEIEQG